MKKCLIYSLLVGVMLYLGAGELSAQTVKLDRWVIGSGGMIDAQNSANMHLSGIIGQLAVEKVTGTYNGKSMDVWQGFWIPSAEVTDVETPTEPSALNELVNYPNPVTSATTFRYNLPGTSNVSLKIYSVSGNLIKVLVNGTQDAGQKDIPWNIQDTNDEGMSSGTYIYELSVTPAQNAGFGGFQPYTLRNQMVVIK